MPSKPVSYTVTRERHAERVRQYLIDWALSNPTQGSVPASVIRRFLHHSSAEALTVPVLLSLSKRGWIELSEPFDKDGLVYFTAKLIDVAKEGGWLRSK